MISGDFSRSKHCTVLALIGLKCRYSVKNQHQSADFRHNFDTCRLLQKTVADDAAVFEFKPDQIAKPQRRIF